MTEDVTEGGEEVPNEPQQFPFPVIGIGASAGGLESLEKLFDLVAVDAPVAFVIIQHLSPDFKSMMDEILRRHTSFAVKRVEGDTEIEPNTVYLNSPKTDLVLTEGKLRLVDRDMNQGLNQPIDRFFRTLARQRSASCAAVILSGSGSDGSRGIKDICERGGVILVESPDHARFDGMPRSAIDTGLVDFVGSAEQIAAWIKRFVDSYHSTEKAGATIVLPDGSELDAPVQGMDRVIQILHERFGMDFAKYKPNMIFRRIGRRLQMMHFSNIEDYISRLETDPEELDQLYRDLLIGVTKFFRDPEAFQYLKTEILPDLVRESSGSLRVWTPGCATGEEAYSLGMTIAEVMEQEGKECDVKIFATDAHRRSINSAAAGIYGPSKVEGISPTQLAKFFKPSGDGYQVRQSLRKMIVFAPHNLLKDASFTNVDLVVCRNTLIYFDAEGQNRALGLMHFGLRMDGYLFLGPSEAPGVYRTDYETVNRRWRIYKKVSHNKTSVTDLRAPSRDFSSRSNSPMKRNSSSAISDRMILNAIEGVAAQFLPPTFVVDESYRLLYSTSGAAKYLRRQEGRFGSTLPELLLSGLRTNVLVGLQRCERQNNPDQPIIVGQIRINEEENRTSGDDESDSTHEEEVRVIIRRFKHHSDQPGGYSVIILAHEDRKAGRMLQGNQVNSEADLTAQQTLEEELRFTKDSLQATIQELETSNEELQATNEEMVASNEELQSTNEELHSVNEELYTVNAEHQSKIEQLTELTEDMDNLFISSNIATLFLDETANIRRITPRAAEIFGLKTEDAGRNLANFRNPLKDNSFYEWIDEVNLSQDFFEQEVLTHGGERYLLRIHPYKSSELKNGVVINLISLQRLEEARRQLELNEERFRGTFENAAVGIAHVGFDGSWLRVNERLCEMVGCTREELLIADFQSITHPDDLESDLELFQQLKAGDIDRYSIRKRYVRQDGSEVPIHLTVSIQHERVQELPYCISVVQDASELSMNEQQLQSAIEQRDQFLAVLSHELRNPLGAATNAIKLLIRDSKFVDPEDARLLQLIDRQATHMKSLVDDLLDTRRITNGEVNLQHDLVDVAEIARECLSAMHASFELKGQRTENQISTSDLPVLGDKTRLLQVLENLLTNANRYTQKGGKVMVRAEAIDGQAVVTIRDNGRGIPADQMESILEMFNRGDSTWGTQGGLGVGLALSRMLVEKHRGELSVSSEGEGKGATFVIQLPLVLDTSVAERKAAQAFRQDQRPPSIPKTIVLIEDDDDARVSLTKLLELDGHTVTPVSNGTEGIDIIRNLKPQIALVDLSMPDMTGITVIERVKRIESNLDTRFIAITGHGQVRDRQATQNAGFAAHLVKPIDLEQLKELIDC